MRQAHLILAVPLYVFAVASVVQPLCGSESPPPAALSEAAKAELIQQRDALVEQVHTLVRGKQLQEGMEVREQIIEIERRVFGDVHQEVAGSLEKMAELAESQRAFARATELYREAEAIYSQLDGPESHRIKDARMAAAYAQQCESLPKWQLVKLENAARQIEGAASHYNELRPVEAMELASQAAETRREILGDRHPLYARALMAVGTYAYSAGKYQPAKESYEKALELSQSLLGSHPDVATCYTNLGNIASYTNNPKAAEGYYAKALAMRRRFYPSDRFPNGHPEIVTALNNMGVLHLDRSQYRQAREYLEESLQIQVRLSPVEQFPDGDAKLAYTLNHLGLVCSRQGAFADARSFLEQALAMRRKLYGPDRFPNGHPQLASSLLSLEELLRQVGDLEGARTHADEALLMYRLLYPTKRYPQGHVRLATGLIYAARASGDAGTYDSALAYDREALLMLRALLPAEVVRRGHPALFSILAHMMQLHHLRGEFRDAGICAEQALAMALRIYPESDYPDGHVDLAVALSGTSALYHDQGDIQKALEYAQRAVAMNRRLYPADRYPAGHSRLVQSLDAVGVILFKLDRFEEARSYHEQSLALARRLDDGNNKRAKIHIASALNNLAFVFDAEEDAAGYERCLLEAVAIMEEDFGEQETLQGQPVIAVFLSNLARARAARGDHEGALEAQSRASEIVARLQPKDTFPSGHRNLMHQRYRTGCLLYAKGDDREALVQAAIAFEMQKSLTRTFAAAASEIGTVNSINYGVHVGDLWLSISLALNEPPSRIYGELWSNRHLAYRTLAVRQQAILDGAASDTATEYQEYLATRRAFARIALSPLSREEDATARRHKNLAELSRKKEKLERSLAGSLPAFARQLNQDRATPEELLKALPPRAAFIDFVEFGRIDPKLTRDGATTTEYLAFVLAERRISMVPLGDAPTIDAALFAWREQLAGKTSARSPLPDAGPSRADVLRKLVWDKLQLVLPDETEMIFLCADGHLSALPWGALPAKRPATVLLERYGFVLVPHGQFLLEQLRQEAPAKNETGTHLLVSNVDYDGQPNHVPDPAMLVRHRAAGNTDGKARWDALPATAQEGTDIIGLLPGRQVTHLAGSSASTTRVLEELPKARRAHLATHGFFADAEFRQALQLDPQSFGGDSLGSNVVLRNPLILSGIVLAGANRRMEPDELGIPRGDGGILTAESIAGLPLHQLDLVTLSACESGLGMVKGEHVYGLQRAFHISGTKTVVSSLWKVDDKATRQLMGHFYRNLYENKMSKLDALRHAQLTSLYGTAEFSLSRALRRKPDDMPAASERSIPMWAAWTISGDWR